VQVSPVAQADSPGEFFVDGIVQVGQGAILEMPAVDIDPRGGQNAESLRLVEVTSYQFIDCRVFELFIEAILVQFQHVCNLTDFCVIQGTLVFKQFVVEFPKFTLIVGSQGGCSRFHGKIVRSDKFVNQFYLFGILLQHLLE
jgi:hypothetical protein